MYKMHLIIKFFGRNHLVKGNTDLFQHCLLWGYSLLFVQHATKQWVVSFRMSKTAFNSCSLHLKNELFWHTYIFFPLMIRRWQLASWVLVNVLQTQCCNKQLLVFDNILVHVFMCNDYHENITLFEAYLQIDYQKITVLKRQQEASVLG